MAYHEALAAPMVLEPSHGNMLQANAMNMLPAAPQKVRGPSVSAVWAGHNYVVTCFEMPGAGGEGV